CETIDLGHETIDRVTISRQATVLSAGRLPARANNQSTQATNEGSSSLTGYPGCRQNRQSINQPVSESIIVAVLKQATFLVDASRLTKEHFQADHQRVRFLHVES
ncbi:MAG: hypothetical protein ACI814_004448, partial [Mariniblastus sp.]